MKYRICNVCNKERRGRGCDCNALERYNLREAIMILQAIQWQEESESAEPVGDWAQ